MVEASDGNLYGTTLNGGVGYVFGSTNHDWGTIFRVTPSGEVSSLFSFGFTNGSLPSGLIQGSDSALYGTTREGGNGFGTIFKITTNGVFTSLFSFNNTNVDGASPLRELAEGEDGNLYGSTSAAGSSYRYGTIFAFNPNGTLTTLTTLDARTGIGAQSLIKGADGILYGVMSRGGPAGGGTFFRLASPPVITSIFESNSATTVTWKSFTNGVYRIDYTTNVANNTWTAHQEKITATGSSTSFTESNQLNPERFYRVVLLPE